MKPAHIAVLALTMAGVAHASSTPWNGHAPAIQPRDGGNKHEKRPDPFSKHKWLPSLRRELTGMGLAHESHWRTLTVKPGDSLSTLFQRAGLPAADWTELLKLKGEADALTHLHPGDHMRIRKTRDGRLAALTYPLDALRTLHVQRAGQRFTQSIADQPRTVRVVRLSGRIRHSLSSAVQHAGASPGVAARLAHILRWRIDLSRSIHPGDRFVIVFRQVYAQNRLVKSGPVLAARLELRDRTLTAFRYIDGQGHVAYYDQTGRSFKPSILRTPVQYTRVSSPFNLHRINPVTHVRRPHYGVDLAAPRGTPIKAAANGHVKFIGRQHGYGRLVILQNFGPYTTRYAHMLRFADHLHKGDFVRQGQTIGYVGESGEATGPHLHFEIRVDGVPKPPLKVALPTGAPISDTRMAAYQQAIAPVLTALRTAPGRGHALLAERRTQAPDDAQHLTVASLSPATPTAGTAHKRQPSLELASESDRPR